MQCLSKMKVDMVEHTLLMEIVHLLRTFQINL